MEPRVNSMGSHGATLGPALCSLLLQPFGYQCSHPDRERGITCLCQVAIGLTYILKGLKWHWYMVWINTWSFGGWAGSSVVQCLFQICKALGSILSTTNR